MMQTKIERHVFNSRDNNENINDNENINVEKKEQIPTEYNEEETLRHLQLPLEI
jgi:hypothetical protein